MGSRISWQKAFETGVPEVDADHQALVRLINTFLEVVEQDEGIIAMDDVFRGLVNYTVEHFDLEERLMAEAGYDGLESHHAAHEALKSKVGRLRDMYLSQPGPAAEKEIREFLGDWLINHILKMDHAYKDDIIAMLKRTGRLQPTA